MFLKCYDNKLTNISLENYCYRVLFCNTWLEYYVGNDNVFIFCHEKHRDNLNQIFLKAQVLHESGADNQSLVKYFETIILKSKAEMHADFNVLEQKLADFGLDFDNLLISIYLYQQAITPVYLETKTDYINEFSNFCNDEDKLVNFWDEYEVSYEDIIRNINIFLIKKTDLFNNLLQYIGIKQIGSKSHKFINRLYELSFLTKHEIFLSYIRILEDFIRAKFKKYLKGKQGLVDWKKIDDSFTTTPLPFKFYKNNNNGSDSLSDLRNALAHGDHAENRQIEAIKYIDNNFKEIINTLIFTIDNLK